MAHCGCDIRSKWAHGVCLSIFPRRALLHWHWGVQMSSPISMTASFRIDKISSYISQHNAQESANRVGNYLDVLCIPIMTDGTITLRAVVLASPIMSRRPRQSTVISIRQRDKITYRDRKNLWITVTSPKSHSTPNDLQLDCLLNGLFSNRRDIKTLHYWLF